MRSVRMAMGQNRLCRPMRRKSRTRNGTTRRSTSTRRRGTSSSPPLSTAGRSASHGSHSCTLRSSVSARRTSRRCSGASGTSTRKRSASSAARRWRRRARSSSRCSYNSCSTTSGPSTTLSRSTSACRPLVTTSVLQLIHARRSNPAKIDKIIASLGVKVRPQDLRAKDTHNLLLSIFSQWLPLAPSAFRAIIDRIPPPAAAQSFRIPRMLHPELGHLDESIAPRNKLESDLYSGTNASDAFSVAYVSKMFAVKVEDLPENQRKQLTADDMRAKAKRLKEAKEKRDQLLAEGKAEEAEAVMAELEETEKQQSEASAKGAQADKQEALIGFARLYSGTISLGQSLYAVLPRYNADLPPSHPQNAKHIQPIKVDQLYMMMGRELLAVKEVQAGNLFAIGGLEGIVLRNATLCGMGSGKEAKEGNARDEDRDCLVNLAGVSNTVRRDYFEPTCRLAVLTTGRLFRPLRSSASLSSRKIRPRCQSSSRVSDCSDRPILVSRRSFRRRASTSS